MKEKLCKLEGMIIEMHIVIMDHHCAKNESNKNNIENAYEAITTVEERGGKCKKANMYAQLMTGQKKSSAIDHFYGCMQWDITKFFSESIKEKHNLLQKGISSNAKKITTIVNARFGRKILNYVTEKLEYLTFREKNTSPQDDDYKIFTTNNEDISRVIQDKFITIKN